MSGIYLGQEATRLLREAVKARGPVDVARDLRISPNAIRNAITGKCISFGTFCACAKLLESDDAVAQL